LTRGIPPQDYAVAYGGAQAMGWAYSELRLGHLLGSFPQENLPNAKIALCVTNETGDK